MYVRYKIISFLESYVSKQYCFGRTGYFRLLMGFFFLIFPVSYLLFRLLRKYRFFKEL